jgi:VWFA-related protein
MRRVITVLVVFAAAYSLSGSGNDPLYRTDVNLVVQTFSVVDKHGNPIGGLRPSDVRVFEDGIPQKLASFTEGNLFFSLEDHSSAASGNSIYILFDTSNGMYANYPYVRDAIAEFIRRLDPSDAAAVYSFSRNLFRASRLTHDHVQARAGLDNISAGDDTAVFNALLLTVRDAARVSGRKAIVLFSSGVDTASALAPGDVSHVAEEEGIPVYVITRPATQNPALFEALRLIAVRSGGKLYTAGSRQEQVSAFQSIREDIRASYTVSYYPAPNPNYGFRKITIEVAAPAGRSYRILSRSGYQPRADLAPPAQNLPPE